LLQYTHPSISPGLPVTTRNTIQLPTVSVFVCSSLPSGLSFRKWGEELPHEGTHWKGTWRAS